MFCLRAQDKKWFLIGRGSDGEFGARGFLKMKPKLWKGMWFGCEHPKHGYEGDKLSVRDADKLPKSNCNITQLQTITIIIQKISTSWDSTVTIYWTKGLTKDWLTIHYTIYGAGTLALTYASQYISRQLFCTCTVHEYILYAKSYIEKNGKTQKALEIKYIWNP